MRKGEIIKGDTMVNSYKYTLITAMLVVLLTASVYGLGIAIEPGGALSYLVFLRPNLDIKPIKVINVNDEPMQYDLVATTEPSHLKGYFPLPDKSWVSFEPGSFRLEPHETLLVKVLLNLPEDDPTIFNRAWSFDINVTQTNIIPDTAASIARLQLGATAVWNVETPSKTELPEKGSDQLSVAPSIYTIQYGDSTINKGEFPIKIRNDDEVAHKYEFETYFPEYGDSIKGMVMDILPLKVGEGGFILDKSWVRAKRDRFLLLFKKSPKIKLEPGETAEQIVVVDLPESSELGNQRYEGIILIKPDGKMKGSRFVRFVFVGGLPYTPSESAE